MKGKLKSFQIYLGACLLIGVIGAPILIAIEKKAESLRQENNKEYCLGPYNTIVCHQKKINELLKARDQENLKNERQS